MAPPSSVRKNVAPVSVQPTSIVEMSNSTIARFLMPPVPYPTASDRLSKATKLPSPSNAELDLPKSTAVNVIDAARAWTAESTRQNARSGKPVEKPRRDPDAVGMRRGVAISAPGFCQPYSHWLGQRSTEG